MRLISTLVERENEITTAIDISNKKFLIRSEAHRYFLADFFFARISAAQIVAVAVVIHKNYSFLSLFLRSLCFMAMRYITIYRPTKKLQDLRKLWKERGRRRESNRARLIGAERHSSQFYKFLTRLPALFVLCVCFLFLFLSCFFLCDLLSHRFLALFAWHSFLNVFACHNFEPKFHYCACLYTVRACICSLLFSFVTICGKQRRSINIKSSNETWV